MISPPRVDKAESSGSSNKGDGLQQSSTEGPGLNSNLTQTLPDKKDPLRPLQAQSDGIGHPAETWN